ncbi:DNA primase [Arthrobacter sp. 260]|nr:DNA primase [Arthrobacter sp. 260]
MTERVCEYCGESINLLRAGARFCSTKHRVYASRKPVLPVEMTSKARWMRWKPVRRGGRVTKLPITTEGKPASSTNTATWCSYQVARQSTLGTGLGFALGEGIGCIDLDHCIIDGVVAEWARAILDSCPPTYIEVSQSGEGLHIFGLLPEGSGRNIRSGEMAIEFYSAGRYIAVTGNSFEGSPTRLADLSGVVASVV